MSIRDIATDRSIEEILHFTTNKGLVGILASGHILSRAQLPTEKYLEHVYEPNAEVRRDGPWLDHVNLSISRLNWEFFGHSRRWHAHEDVWWCAVAISPAVLELPDVVFTTTNNIYTGCRRAPGEEGLKAMFADRVPRWAGNVVVRPPDFPDSWTTDHQAEVLVPRKVRVEHLSKIYVATEAHADIVASQCEILLGEAAPLPIVIDPDVFEPQLAPR